MAWAAAIGALGSFANTAYSGIMNEKSYHYNMNLQQNAQRWQERMSNTAHQREVEDLRKAGINPLYTATGGTGANVGGAGANSTSSQLYDIASPFFQGLTTYANMRNQTNATNADVALKGAQAQDYIGNMQERLYRIEKLKADTDLTRGQRHMLDYQQRQIQANIRQLDSLSKLNISSAQYNDRRSSGHNVWNADTWADMAEDLNPKGGNAFRNIFKIKR